LHELYAYSSSSCGGGGSSGGNGGGGGEAQTALFKDPVCTIQ